MTAERDKSEIREELLKIIEEEGLIRKERLTPDATLESIGMASYDMVMILMGIEDRFGVYISVDSDLSEVTTLSGLLDVLADKIKNHDGQSAPAPEQPSAGAQ